jgi:hypothetical protein
MEAVADTAVRYLHTVAAVDARCHLAEASAEAGRRRHLMVAQAAAMRQVDLAAVVGTFPAVAAAMPQHRAAVAAIAQAEAAVTTTAAVTADVTKL